MSRRMGAFAFWSLVLGFAASAFAGDQRIESIPTNGDEVADAVLPPDWRHLHTAPSDQDRAAALLDDLTAGPSEAERVDQGFSAMGSIFSGRPDPGSAGDATPYGAPLGEAGGSLEDAAQLLGHVFDEDEAQQP